jgi:hypothetical protein
MVLPAFAWIPYKGLKMARATYSTKSIIASLRVHGTRRDVRDWRSGENGYNNRNEYLSCPSRFSRSSRSERSEACSLPRRSPCPIADYTVASWISIQAKAIEPGINGLVESNPSVCLIYGRPAGCQTPQSRRSGWPLARIFHEFTPWRGCDHAYGNS